MSELGRTRRGGDYIKEVKVKGAYVQPIISVAIGRNRPSVQKGKTLGIAETELEMKNIRRVSSCGTVSRPQIKHGATPFILRWCEAV